MSTHKATLLRIKILGAAGLLKADAKPADAYCACHVTNQKKLKFQTPVVFDSDQPVWDYVHEFKLYHPHNSLQFSVHDWDELLGKTTLEAAQFFPQGCQTTLNLTGRAGLKATLEVDIELPHLVSATPITPTATPAKASQSPEIIEGSSFNIRITVISALGFQNVDEDISGAYCVCENGGKEEFRTETVAAAESATWRHAHEMLGVSSSDSLSFSVWRKGVDDNKHMLGKLSLLSSQFLPGGFDGKLVLKDFGMGPRITLALKVEVLHDRRAVRIQNNLDAGLEYALGWNPKREKAVEKKPSNFAKSAPAARQDLVELEYSLGWSQAIAEEQHLLAEKRSAVKHARHAVLGLRQRAAQREAEAAKLEQLIALYIDETDCGFCSRRSMDARIILRALCRTGRAVYDLAAGSMIGNALTSAKSKSLEGYDALHEVAEALSSAAHLNNQIAELAAYLATEAVTCGMVQAAEKVPDNAEKPRGAVRQDLLKHLRQTLEKAQDFVGGSYVDEYSHHDGGDMLPRNDANPADSLPFPVTMP